MHIIGRHQVTSDLPEFRDLKSKPLPEYHGETVDQRTRGLDGRLTSCGEENRLQLANDHSFGRDILVHEFAHAIRQYGIPLEVVERFNEQYRRSLARGLWRGAYAGANADEFFAPAIGSRPEKNTDEEATPEVLFSRHAPIAWRSRG